MQRPLENYIFSTVQLQVFESKGSKWLHVTTDGDGMMVNKFDLSQSTVFTDVAPKKSAPMFWELRSGFMGIKLKCKSTYEGTFKGSIVIKLFGVLPVYWCWLSGRVSTLISLASAIKV